MKTNNEKKYTLKSVQAEIRKIEKKIEENKKKIDDIVADNQAYAKQISELNKISRKLYVESLIDSSMTSEQLNKLVELEKRINKKIDNFEIDDIMQALELIHDEKKEKPENAKKAE